MFSECSSSTLARLRWNIALHCFTELLQRTCKERKKVENKQVLRLEQTVANWASQICCRCDPPDHTPDHRSWWWWWSVRAQKTYTHIHSGTQAQKWPCVTKLTTKCRQRTELLHKTVSLFPPLSLSLSFFLSFLKVKWAYCVAQIS